MRRLLPLVLTLASALLPQAARGEPAPPDKAAPASPAQGDGFVPLPKIAARALAPSAPALAPALAVPPELAGVPVSDVEVVVEDGEVTPPKVTSVKVGDAVTPAAARRALGEVLGSALFARGTVAFVADPPRGARLVVRVWRRRLIANLRVDLHGAPLEREEVLREAGLASGGELVTEELQEQRARVEALFASRGFPSARAGIQVRPTDDPLRALVVLDVEPGPALVIEQRFFYRIGTDDPLVRALTLEYAVKEGERVDEQALGAADATLERRVRAAGWHNATVYHDVGRFEGKVALRIRVDARSRFLPRFEGNVSYDVESLTGALGMDEDTDRSPQHLTEKLRDFYVHRGFLDVEVKLETRGRPIDATGGDKFVFLVFKIIEHERVAVRSRRYPCLDPDEIASLSGGGPSTPAAIGSEIDSYLEEDLPGSDLLRPPHALAIDEVIGGRRGDVPKGGRAVPIDLDPNHTFSPDTYDRAAAHVQELYRNEGFLSALVGPVQVVRPTCDPRSPPGRCLPLALPPLPDDQCGVDPRRHLPVPAPATNPALTCHPDPIRGVTCAPWVELLVPVKLGPRTRLYDAAFVGVKSIAERELASMAKFPLGLPVNRVQIDDAIRRMLDKYRDEGFVYADIKYALEPSLDSTNARLRFDVSEGVRVRVKEVVVRGNDRTKDTVIQRRITLASGQYFRASEARRTQELLGALGVFASVSVGLEDPDVPQPEKVVVVTLVERQPQRIDAQGGFSTGEGLRGSFEYGQINLGGYAVGLTARVQASYLPDFAIIDPGFRANILCEGTDVPVNCQRLSLQQRLARRVSGSVVFPEVGLGPRVRGQVDAIHVNDLFRDFRRESVSFFGSIAWRPSSAVTFTAGQSVEGNDVTLFRGDSLQALQVALQNDRYLASQLRVPEGLSIALAQRLVFTWDRRDNALHAHRGTYLSSSVEFVNAYPLRDSDTANLPSGSRTRAEGHYFRLTQTVGAYIPLGRTVTLAGQLRIAQNIKAPWIGDQSNNQPYPDRLFYMGGFESMRGYYQDTFVPQDRADAINAGKLKISDVPIRGGNLMLNPRAELRFPLRGALEGVLFMDLGNLWVDPFYLLTESFSLRTTVGTGLRLQTPVGPLVADYGVNVTRRAWEDFGTFHFAIGLF